MHRTTIKALLIDLDGTVYSRDHILPTVRETFAELVNLGMPYRFITNTTGRSRQELVQRLAGMGITTSVNHMFIAPQAAALYCRKAGYERIKLITSREEVAEEFAGLQLVEDRPDVLVLGDLWREFSHATLNPIFQDMMAGIPLIAMQKSRFWETADGLTMDLGPFVAALEYAAGTKAVVVGKPSREFFQLAIQDWDISPPHIAVIGDDVENDVAGGQNAGLQGILVKTGKYIADRENLLDIRPDRILENFAGVLECIG